MIQKARSRILISGKMLILSVKFPEEKACRIRKLRVGQIPEISVKPKAELPPDLACLL